MSDSGSCGVAAIVFTAGTPEVSAPTVTTPWYESAWPCDSFTSSAPPCPSRTRCDTATSSHVVSGTSTARFRRKSVTVKGCFWPGAVTAPADSSAAAATWSSAAAKGSTRWPAMVWSLR